MKKKVAILASGGGSNLQALLDAMKDPAYPAQAVLVFSDKAGAGALKRAEAAGVPTAHLDPKDFPGREAFDQAVAGLIREVGADLVCFAGYLRIITKALVQPFAGRILNVHPALLPDFGGPGMYGIHVHEAVIRSGVKKSGATVHWVTEGVDAGPILMQEEIPVLPGDDPESLAARVLELEHRLYPKALEKACRIQG